TVPNNLNRCLGKAGFLAANAIAAAADGVATVVGNTCNTNFPMAMNSYGGGDLDAYVARLSPSGNAILWARYLGGLGEDVAHTVAIDPTGHTYVGGWTRGTPEEPFPVTAGAWITARPETSPFAEYDGFALKLGPSGELLWSTY